MPFLKGKRDMKKLTAILSVLLCTILLLVGCNNIAADTATSSSSATPESSLSTSGMQTIIGADSSVKVLNAYESLDYALNKLEGYIEQGIVEEDYMETLKVLSVALKDIEADLNADNASHIKDLMVTADDTVSSVMYMSDDSAYLNSLNDISATVSRIKESADRLISNTGTGGGNKEDTNVSSNRVTVSSAEDNTTNNEGTTTSNTTTMTPAEEDNSQTIDTSKIEQGDYTAGGYASTKADSKYKDNGILTWSEGNGLLFDTTQTKDLYNFIKSGYTSLRTVDARIQSRKGGTDNPRIAWYESYELGKDNAFFTEYEDGYTGNTITVTYENINCSNTLLNMLKKPMKEDTDGDGVFETASKAWNDLIKRNDTEDVQKALCVTPENTSITYSFRNYCGDSISVGVRGPNTTMSGYCNISDTETGQAIAGVDYTLTCDDDPEAFKLISGDELKNYYSCETRFGISINENSTQVLVDSSKMQNRAAITKCSDYSVAGVIKPNSLGAGAQFYTGVKPGIYHCTITLKDGKQIPIVIENLPIHYEDKLWGGKSQSEIDACVKYVQQSRNMLYGQYIGLDGTNRLNTLFAGSIDAKDKINVADDTRENLSKAVKLFNDSNFYEFGDGTNGDRIELKDTEAAGEWWLHFTSMTTSNFVWGGSHGTYRALELFTNDPNGDCETASAGMACILNVMGYTTRYITNSSHAYIEIKVPAAITKSGEDQWLVMNNGELVTGKPSNYRKMIRQGHTINFVNKGFNSYWVQDYPELLK